MISNGVIDLVPDKDAVFAESTASCARGLRRGVAVAAGYLTGHDQPRGDLAAGPGNALLHQARWSRSR